MKTLKFRAVDGDGVMVYDVKNPFDYIALGYPVMEGTGITDSNDNEIYDGDYVSDGTLIFKVKWHNQQAAWWLESIERMGNKTEPFILVLENQMLGNGYYKRRDLVKIGNEYENAELSEILCVTKS